MPQKDSVAYRIAVAMQEILQRMEFTAIGGEDIGTIDPEAIVIRKTMRQTAEGEEGFSQEQTPGLIITLPKHIHRPANEGDNCDDDVYYDMLVQIIDEQDDDEEGLRTYSRWSEDIAKTFSRSSLDDIDGNPQVWDADGYVDIGYSTQIDLFDETMHNRHGMAVCGVLVRLLSEETNTIAG